jgi:hypothetical protein
VRVVGGLVGDLDPGDIGAGAEMTAFAAQHDDAHPGIVAQALKRRGHAFEHLGVEGVAFVRTRQRQACDPARAHGDRQLVGRHLALRHFCFGSEVF